MKVRNVRNRSNVRNRRCLTKVEGKFVRNRSNIKGKFVRNRRCLTLEGRKFVVLKEFSIGGKSTGFVLVEHWEDGGPLNSARFYFSKRIRGIHLYRKDNSYCLSTSIGANLNSMNVGFVIIQELVSGKKNYYLFRLKDYLNSKTIKWGEYDEQYSLPLEKALAYGDFEKVLAKMRSLL